MKKLLTILGMVTLFIVAGAATGDVKIKQAPLKYQKVAHWDGDILFSNLCASCHGASGMGDGPAAPALKKEVPDLTVLSANNGGVYPRDMVEDVITGKNRVVAHGSIDMPVWGQLFMDLRPDWNKLRRQGFVDERIETLTTHVESLQIEEIAGR